MKSKNTVGHLAAIFTMTIWGTTFISTKVLLREFEPVEILFFRFVIGIAILAIVYPHRLKGTDWRQECLFIGAGLSGITFYYLLENIALTYTMASNVGVIISVAPFFTAILSRFFTKDREKLQRNFIVGFVLAMIGIALISFNGAELHLNPMGDVLAVLAAFLWAIYSILIKKVGELGHKTILTTRRIFFYGILFMIPALFLFDFQWNLRRFASPLNLFNILFLGVGASALCFVTWNFAVRVLGAVKSSVYIYMTPVITVVTSVLILQERATVTAGIGIVFAMAGLFLSEKKSPVKPTVIQNSSTENL